MLDFSVVSAGVFFLLLTSEKKPDLGSDIRGKHVIMFYIFYIHINNVYA